MTYVLVASVCKNNDRERCKNSNGSLNMDDVDVATCRSSVVRSEVIDHKNDQVTDGNERND